MGLSALALPHLPRRRSPTTTPLDPYDPLLAARFTKKPAETPSSGTFLYGIKTRILVVEFQDPAEGILQPARLDSCYSVIEPLTDGTNFPSANLDGLILPAQSAYGADHRCRAAAKRLYQPPFGVGPENLCHLQIPLLGGDIPGSQQGQHRVPGNAGKNTVSQIRSDQYAANIKEYIHGAHFFHILAF